MKKTGNLILGIILLLLGIFFLSLNFNIIPNLSFLETFRNLWPLGFIISGILLIFKQKTLSLLIFILTIILATFFFIVPDTTTITYENTIQTINTPQNNQAPQTTNNQSNTTNPQTTNNLTNLQGGITND